MLGATLECGYDSPKPRAACSLLDGQSSKQGLQDLPHEHMRALFSVELSKRQYHALTCGSHSRWKTGCPVRQKAGPVLLECQGDTPLGPCQAEGGGTEGDVVSSTLCLLPLCSLFPSPPPPSNSWLYLFNSGLSWEGSYPTRSLTLLLQVKRKTWLLHPPQPPSSKTPTNQEPT